MDRNLFTFLVGGKAGEGVKKAGSTAAMLFSRLGRHCVQMDDYQSLIRGGHNFSVVSSSIDEIFSHYAKADLAVCFDKRSYLSHREHLTGDGIIVYNSDVVQGESGIGIPMSTLARSYPRSEMRIGVAAVSILCASLGMSREETSALVREEYSRDSENNCAYAEAVHTEASAAMSNKFSLRKGDRERAMLSGNQAISLGAAAAGMNMFFAYPMTPSSSILHYLASLSEKLKIAVIHPENEIAVMNMAVGAAFAGSRVMVASSGGGFALMEEGVSLAGMTEAPVLCVLSSRPGPSTGVPTYTEQADLLFALHQGHGEFPRLVASPGDIAGAFYLSAQMMSLVWKFQTPGILLTEKHLSEGTITVDLDVKNIQPETPSLHTGGDYKRYLQTPDGVSPLLFPPSGELIKWNSYEHDELGITTEKPELIAAMHDKRNRKGEAIVEHMKKLHTVNRFGSGEAVIITYGSTTMSVREALQAAGIEATIVQPVFLSPLPVWELEEFRDRRPVVVEMSSTGQFARLLEERAGIKPHAVIKRYDGRPFEPVELAEEIRHALPREVASGVR